MTSAHRLDCKKEAADCRFIIRSEDEEEAIELAKNHTSDVHRRDFTGVELRNEYVETV